MMSQVIPYKGHDAIFLDEARLKTKHRDLKLKKLLIVLEIKKKFVIHWTTYL